MRTFFMPLFLAAALAGCSAPPLTAPCTDFDCSGHGVCTLVGGTPTCSCDSGYSPSPSGWLCLPPGDTSLCAGIDCSGHGSCVSMQGLPRCACDDGYALDATRTRCLSGCEEIDCDGHGSCALDGVPRCSCDEGYRTTPEGTSCVLSEGPYVLYTLGYEQYPDWDLGYAVIDFAHAGNGELVETMSMSMHLGWGQAFTRTHKQRWKLDASGAGLLEARFDDRIVQGKADRRRRADVKFNGGIGYVQAQRLDLSYETRFTYNATETPVPMIGGFEYPGWTLGCFSPLFYMLVLRRYDLAAGGEQEIEVFWPSAGGTGTVLVRLHESSTSLRPVLELVDLGWQITYEGDLPLEIKNPRQGWALRRAAQTMPVDINMSAPPASTPFAPASPPEPASEKSVSISAADGTVIAGVIARPQETGALHPAVLMVSGPRSLDRDRPYDQLPRSPLYAHLAGYLAQAGFVTLRYDPRGRGSSGGSFRQLALAPMVTDARAALDALAASPGIDLGRIYVLSFGYSAAAALPLLSGGTAVRGYVGLSPLLGDVAQAVTYAQTEHMKVSGLSGKAVEGEEQELDALLKQIGSDVYPGGDLWWDTPVTLWRDLLSYDGSADLARFAGPVLLLRGEEDLELSDRQVGLAQVAAALEGKTNLTLQSFPQLTYNFTVGTKAGLWERSQLPLALSPQLVSVLGDWLAAH